MFRARLPYRCPWIHRGNNHPLVIAQFDVCPVDAQRAFDAPPVPLPWNPVGSFDSGETGQRVHISGFGDRETIEIPHVAHILVHGLRLRASGAPVLGRGHEREGDERQQHRCADEPALVHREIRKAVPCHHQATGIRHERNVREKGIPTESIQDPQQQWHPRMVHRLSVFDKLHQLNLQCSSCWFR